ncbi:MAG: deoxyribodipyrimidine photo-lyase [Jatrophihabitans sp.]
MTSVLWLRRDLRLRDNPALHEAAKDGPVVVLFVLDQALLKPAGAPRIAFLYRTLRALDAELRDHGGALIVRRGDPANAVARVAREAGASSVHISADYGPYGRRRDEQVEQSLDDLPLVRTGSPYAVAPGRVTKSDGEPYKVYTPFYRAWCQHGWREPAATITGRVDWHASLDSVDIPNDPDLPADLDLPDAGEAAARAAWKAYLDKGLLKNYADDRNRPDLDRTSRMSVYLKYGCIHPRTMLADLGPADETFRKEIAWREFYAAVLHEWPGSAREYYQPRFARMEYARADTAVFDAWRQGRTGYPIVDAGMRQLLGEGWMHNRVRMIVASFLVKDLHIEWTHGARHFMKHLVDGDLASNQHGWQWTAGTGTDASPFYRVFNPVTQGVKFDPDGDYVRRWIPELADVSGKAVHEPWDLPNGGPTAYPRRVVDHAEERVTALERYGRVKN